MDYVEKPAPKKKKNKKREDVEEEINTLNTVNQFLTQKLKQNEQVLLTLQKDIQILKDIYVVEKNISGKTQVQLKRREADLAELRESSLRNEDQLRDQIQNVSLREQELEQKLEQVTLEHSVLLQQRNSIKLEASIYKKKAQELTTQNSK